MHIVRKLSLRLLRMQSGILLSGTLLFVLASASLIYLIEPATFKDRWFNALYWVMTTVATVGYGDFYPTTVPGKTFAMFLYVFGIGLLSLVIGKIIDYFVEIHRKRGAGLLKYHGKEHIILINWSKKAKLAIEEILSTDEDIEIVIIDESDKLPFDHAKVHFVSGDPTSVDTLENAAVHHARAAIIFSDSRIDDSSLVDGKSLLIASSIEKHAPEVHTTVEIVMEKHIQNFRHVKVNEFVLSYDAVSRLAVRAALHEGNIEIFTQLLSRQDGDDLFEIKTDSAWESYGDAFQALINKGATLIADGNDMGINRRLKDPIPDNAKLYVISDKKTIAALRREGR
ncbi:potassium channel protein [Cohnella luojiensis]|uniref:Potassium channel protein n=1 Tax=Cohnella luojiensis TaxID=652876 RepID=A0A4Y8M2G0_9BACL|nr:potassium channel family protein [Cohnella luojiensis]TFE28219.1 potassium channel protein [Cohnella luojiensis]